MPPFADTTGVAAGGAGADVYSCAPQRVSLEEMFVKIMGEDRGL